MSRIYTNLPSLLSALYMERNMQALNRSLERLATGIQINSARDDPGGIITTDALRGELTGIQSAITNAERANNLMATAEGSIEGISDLLLDIQATIFEVAGDGALTDEEWAIVKRHPVIGHDIIAPISFLENATAVVKYHHERHDGKGYPDGRSQDDLPLDVKTVIIADASKS